ncbi:MAG: hypothetical protein DDT23_00968 [candidate division WS2 bacterium]|nr:hypothetical protein [Candidatus Lithacetigena glycinireducens]
MSITPANIRFFLSGGGANTNPNLSLGGAISSTEMVDNVLHNLFARVEAAEAATGSVRYRAIYVRNTHATLTYEAVLAFISLQTTSPNTSIRISLAGEGVNGTMQTIPNENTAPVGRVFVAADGVAAGLPMGNLAPGAFFGIWVERTVNAGALAFSSDTASVSVRGETV